MVPVRYYVKEITAAVELAIQFVFFHSKEASYAEFFYGFKRSHVRTVSLIAHILYPYVLQKIKTRSRHLYSLLALCDFWLKCRYLLTNEGHYSLYYKWLRVELVRDQQVKRTFLSQYGMFLFYMALKLLDNYYARKKADHAGSRHVEAPFKKKGHKMCPICRQEISIASVLQSSGYVYCYRCIYQFVHTYRRCPITNQDVTPAHILKIYV